MDFFFNLFLAMLRKMGISYCCFSHSEEISLLNTVNSILKINIDVKVAQNRKKLTLQKISLCQLLLFT